MMFFRFIASRAASMVALLVTVFLVVAFAGSASAQTRQVDWQSFRSTGLSHCHLVVRHASGTVATVNTSLQLVRHSEFRFVHEAGVPLEVRLHCPGSGVYSPATGSLWQDPEGFVPDGYSWTNSGNSSFSFGWAGNDGRRESVTLHFEGVEGAASRGELGALDGRVTGLENRTGELEAGTANLWQRQEDLSSRVSRLDSPSFGLSLSYLHGLDESRSGFGLSMDSYLELSAPLSLSLGGLLHSTGWDVPVRGAPNQVEPTKFVDGSRTLLAGTVGLLVTPSEYFFAQGFGGLGVHVLSMDSATLSQTQSGEVFVAKRHTQNVFAGILGAKIGVGYRPIFAEVGVSAAYSAPHFDFQGLAPPGYRKTKGSAWDFNLAFGAGLKF